MRLWESFCLTALLFIGAFAVGIAVFAGITAVLLLISVLGWYSVYVGIFLGAWWAVHKGE